MKFPNIVIPNEELAAFCQRNHIRTLALFGSVLRDDFGPESDIDVVVEFEEGYTPGLFRIFDMENELSAILGGRKVDLRTPADLSRYFRDEVIRRSEVCYGT